MTGKSKTSRGWLAAFYVLVFLISFLARVWHPISRPTHWVDRSDAFYDAVIDEQDWGATYQMAHPGVTTMIVAGLTRRAYGKAINSDSFFLNLYEGFVNWAAPSGTSEFGMQTVSANVGVAFTLALLIVAAVSALYRLGGWKLAVSGALLQTLSPVLLTYGRVVHLDAMVAMLMLVSSLFLLLYTKDNKWRYLVISGLVGGLAFLTKPVSVFMFPYLGLSLTVPLAVDIYHQWDDHAVSRWRWIAGLIGKQLMLPAAIWLVLAASTFAIWPSMWVQPVWSLTQIVDYTLFQANEVHPNPVFFLSRVYTANPPGMLFYPVALLFNSSFITLPLAVIAIVLYVVKRKSSLLPLPARYFWLLVAFTGFYLLQMTFGDKMLQRYIMPAHAGFEVLAAVGLTSMITAIEHAVSRARPQFETFALPVFVGLVLILHLLLIVVYYPDIGAHKNHLLGGNPAAVNVLELGGQNEGILYAADYFNALPDIEGLKVGMPFFAMTSTPQYINGIERVLLQRPAALKQVDYVFYTAELFQRYEFTPDEVQATPQVTVMYDNVPYVILYANKAQPTTPPLVISRGGSWLIVLAWLWTLGLAGMLIWAIGNTAETEP